MIVDAANPRSYLGTGTAWSDLSGNSNNATLVNTPVYSTNNNGYFTFTSASSQYANLGSPASLGNINSTLTISAWVTLSSFPTSGNIFAIYSTGQSGSTSTQTFLRVDNTSVSQVVVGSYNGSSNFLTTYSTTNLSLNTWYNIAGQYTGTAWVLYVNGVQVNSTTTTGPVSASVIVTIGVENNFGGTLQRYYSGNISSVSVYNRSLSASEIQRLSQKV